jgi:hypothetical protein
MWVVLVVVLDAVISRHICALLMLWAWLFPLILFFFFIYLLW